MIKNITINNLLSFKERTTVDFQVHSKNQIKECVYEYNLNENSRPIFISNLALIYGKNNSGKSNFLKAIKSAFQFIAMNDSKVGTPFKKYATQQNDNIEFEVEIIGKVDLFRYGFIIAENDIIKEEWLYAKINGSKIESEIFYRSGNTFKLNKYLRQFKTFSENIKDDKLFLSPLKTFKIKEIDDLFFTINNLKFESLEDDIEMKLDFEKFDYLCTKENTKILLNFIKNYDVNIKSILIERISEIDLETMKKIRKAIIDNRSSGKNFAEILKEISIEFSDNQIEHLLTHSIYEVSDKDQKQAYTFQVTFFDTIREEEYSLDFGELSFGTRKLIQLLIDTLFAEDGTVFLIDEIEHGFHKNLLNHYFDFLIESIKHKRLQFIVTTHEEDLLDRKDISTESMIIFDNFNSTLVHYVSDFNIRGALIKSKRYLTGALGGIPNLK